jgi:hypothetical protein
MMILQVSTATIQEFIYVKEDRVIWEPGWIGFDGDIFALYDELKSKGSMISLPPTNFSWALEMQIEDPDGHILRFGTDPNYDEPFLD